jgi:hypothetical protein
MKDYSDDCKHRGDPKVQCKLMDMSCAMFHTRMNGTRYAKEHDGKCPFYEVNP